MLKKLYKIIFKANKNSSFNFNNLKSALLIRDDSIGDLITTLPFLFSLKKKYPHIQWTVLVSSRNVSLVKLFTDLNYIVVPFGSSNISLFFKLQRHRGKYDLIIDLFERRITRSAVILATLNPLHTIGVMRREKYGLKSSDFSRIELPWKLDYQLPFLENYRLYFNYLTGSNISKREYLNSVPLNLPIKSINKAREFIESFENKVLLLNIQGSDNYRTFNAENTQVLVNFLAKNTQFDIVITAMPEYLNELKSKINLVEHVSFIYPETKIEDIIAICQHVSVIVSIDTALVHIASVLNKPIIGIYIEERLDNLFFAPYSDKSRMILSDYIDKLDREETKILASKIQLALTDLDLGT